MGRAPRAVQPLALSRTRQRMAPGGRMWGESPIRELGNDRLLLRGAGSPGPPPDLAGMFWRSTEIEFVYGDGGVYPPPILPQEIPIASVGVDSRDITGMPAVILVAADMYRGLTPPAGWQTLAAVESSTHSAAVWAVQSYAGQPFTGAQATAMDQLPLSGANCRLRTILMVLDGVGGVSADLVAGNSTTLTLADPGGLYRMQPYSIQAWYQHIWSPPLPDIPYRANGLFASWVITEPEPGVVGPDAGWVDAERALKVWRDQPAASGTYTCDHPSGCISFNLRFG